MLAATPSFRDFLSGGTLRLHSPACLLGHSRGGRRALLCSANRRVDYRCSSFCSLVLPVLISGRSLSLPYDSCRCVFHHNCRFVFSFPQPALFCVQKTAGFYATCPFFDLQNLGVSRPVLLQSHLSFLYGRRSRPVLLDSRLLPSVEAFLEAGTFRDPLALSQPSFMALPTPFLRLVRGPDGSCFHILE